MEKQHYIKKAIILNIDVVYYYSSNDIGSEYPYIFECSFPNVVVIRKKHIPSYYTRYPNFPKNDRTFITL
jgi:hypothetical protein